MNEAPVASEKLRLDGQGRLDEDIVCRKCGYNLRGLLADSVCPECGTPVGRSTHGDLLRFCDPAWVGTLASGMNWIVAGIICYTGIICYIGSVVLMMLLFRALGGPGSLAWFQWAVLAIGLVSLIGHWRLTTPDPVRVEAEPSITARSLVRIAMSASFVMSISATGAMQAGRVVGVGVAMSVISVVQSGLGLIGTIAVFVYARQLALRIPDERLARSTRVVMWGFAAVLLFGLVAGLLSAVLLSNAPPQPGPGGVNPPRRGVMGPAVISYATGLGFLVFGIWTLILIVRYRRAFANARDQAMQSWAQPAAAVDGPISRD
jgi:hypothetical protein